MRFSVRPSPKPAVDLPAEISFLSVLAGIPRANEASWGRMSALAVINEADLDREAGLFAPSKR
jgi:hypothetical protein